MFRVSLAFEAGGDPSCSLSVMLSSQGRKPAPRGRAIPAGQGACISPGARSAGLRHWASIFKTVSPPFPGLPEKAKPCSLGGPVRQAGGDVNITGVALLPGRPEGSHMRNPSRNLRFQRPARAPLPRLGGPDLTQFPGPTGGPRVGSPPAEVGAGWPTARPLGSRCQPAALSPGSRDTG